MFTSLSANQVPTTEDCAALTADELCSALRNEGFSLRAASYITDVLFPASELKVEPRGEAVAEDSDYYGIPVCRMAKEHLARNGGKPSEKVQHFLNRMRKFGTEKAAIYLVLFCRAASAKRAALDAKWEAEKTLNAVKQWLEGGEKTHAEYAKAEREAGEEWWEREGKYEDELEQRGESKYFYAENESRLQFGRRELTAREYLGK